MSVEWTVFVQESIQLSSFLIIQSGRHYSHMIGQNMRSIFDQCASLLSQVDSFGRGRTQPTCVVWYRWSVNVRWWCTLFKRQYELFLISLRYLVSILSRRRHGLDQDANELERTRILYFSQIQRSPISPKWYLNSKIFLLITSGNVCWNPFSVCSNWTACSKARRTVTTHVKKIAWGNQKWLDYFWLFYLGLRITD